MTYNIRDKLENLKLESKGFCATPSGRFIYEVDNEAYCDSNLQEP